MKRLLLFLAAVTLCTMAYFLGLMVFFHYDPKREHLEQALGVMAFVATFLAIVSLCAFIFFIPRKPSTKDPDEK